MIASKMGIFLKDELKKYSDKVEDWEKSQYEKTVDRFKIFATKEVVKPSKDIDEYISYTDRQWTRKMS